MLPKLAPSPPGQGTGTRGAKHWDFLLLNKGDLIMITKFNKSGYECCYHYCDYFEQWIGWSSLNSTTYYCDSKDEVISKLLEDIDSYLLIS